MGNENILPIKGLQKTSLVDFPPHTVATIFFGGCNFRCPYCQNPDLVLRPDDLQTLPEEQVLSFLSEKRKWLDGVCITGGEPLSVDISGLLGRIKEMRLLVKLDTNGSFPGRLKELIDKKLVDYIAIDIKGPINKYELITNSKINIEKIKKSVDMIMNCGIDYEFRTTVVPNLLDEKDFEDIGRWLNGANKFFIQQFSNKNCLIEEYKNIKPYQKERLKEFKNILGKYIKTVDIR